MTSKSMRAHEFSSLFQYSSSALFALLNDDNLSFHFVNNTLLSLLGFETVDELYEFTNRSFVNIIHPKCRSSVIRSLYISLNNNESLNICYSLISHEGKETTVLHSSSCIVHDDNRDLIYVTLIDVTDIANEFMNREARYKDLAERDGMTGLYNREAAKTKIDHLLDLSEAPFSLFLIDIDDFKYVNDNFGHPVGDKVLVSLGHYLRNCFRSDDIVARIGGDEFLVFAKGLGNQKSMARIIDKLSRGPFVRERKSDVIDETLRQASYIPTISVGIITVNDNDTSFNELYSAADDLLYDAKHEGKHRIKYREL